MKAPTIRQEFINYFRKHNHKFLKQSDVFIKDDPTLMFVNAGMNQLKKVFLSEESFKEEYDKLMNSQICIRAGGKHNDFDDVGKDSYHLTCFEMLGNWSLCSYGKEDAIKMAFNFLAVNCKLNIEQMYVTYFMGDDDIPEDTETLEIWKRYIPNNRIVKGSPKDNFWKMGDNGPCGFCTEIHYDLVGGRSVPELVNVDNPDVIEIWNIVFIQYNQVGDKYIPLGKTFIDTGMGMERLAMVLQNKKSVYDTDVFRSLIGWAQALSGAEFYGNNYDENNGVDMAYRIFADHMRTSVICIFQGIEFDAHGRGFVLRKIFRRMLMYYYIYLADGMIGQIMNRDEIKIIISQVLNYFLFGNHDAVDIQNKFIVEEKLALGKWCSIETKYKRYMKMHKCDAIIVGDKLKNTDGIDGEFIKNIRKLKFKQV